MAFFFKTSRFEMNSEKGDSFTIGKYCQKKSWSLFERFSVI
ncbi:hypothetical protein BSM4216_2474 [Bacillus smithii]|nr:hypothetical protein BSM4216_2474 [Bacillus smithii]